MILAEVHFGRDSLVGCALTLQHLTDFGGTASSLRASLPQYYMSKEKITFASLAKSDGFLSAVAKKYAAFPLRTDDGIRADFPSGEWIHVRKSNTEPIVRVIAESKTQAGAESLAQQLAK